MIKMGLSSLGSSHFHGHNGGVRGHALVAKATFHSFYAVFLRHMGATGFPQASSRAGVGQFVVTKSTLVRIVRLFRTIFSGRFAAISAA